MVARVRKVATNATSHTPQMIFNDRPRPQPYFCQSPTSQRMRDVTAARTSSVNRTMLEISATRLERDFAIGPLTSGRPGDVIGLDASTCQGRHHLVRDALHQVFHVVGLGRAAVTARGRLTV